MTKTRAVLIAALTCIIGFAIGYTIQLVRANRIQSELEATKRALTFQEIEASLGAATVEAWRGGFEPARQLMSTVFTELQSAREAAPEGARGEIDAILSQRDATITALSRSDPQSGQILGSYLTRLRSALGHAQAAPPVSTSPNPVTTTAQ